jgi:hypothetical protein
MNKYEKHFFLNHKFYMHLAAIVLNFMIFSFIAICNCNSILDYPLLPTLLTSCITLECFFYFEKEDDDEFMRQIKDDEFD